MRYNRNSREYFLQQRERIDLLTEEGLSGRTQRDTLKNTAFSMEGEVEAMYFQRSRNFLQTVLAHEIFSVGQDICGGEYE